MRAALTVAKSEITSWNEEIGYDPADLLDDPVMQQIDAALAGYENKSGSETSTKTP